ncbi:MAG TPA: patatin-like phospholipase family protein [Candidatus Binatia bacterium]|jgi:hypothetical protein
MDADEAKTYPEDLLPWELRDISRRREKTSSGRPIPWLDPFVQAVEQAEMLIAEAERVLDAVRRQYRTRRWLRKLWPVPAIEEAESRLNQLLKLRADTKAELERAAREAGHAPNLTDFNLVGLAFSGGGIRSATFNLGILQGLADLGILRFFDYLSTVSGGGYIGSWLAAWIWHERTSPGGGLAAVEKQLKPALVARRPQSTKPEEPEAIFHLRRYSNYLTPRLGFFSQDTWTGIAIYVRNLLLIQLILVPSLAFVLLIPKILTKGFQEVSSDRLLWTGMAALLLAAVVALVSVASALNRLRMAQERHFHLWKLQWLICVPLAAAALIFSWLFGMQRLGLAELPPLASLTRLLLADSSWAYLGWALTLGILNVLVFIVCAAWHRAESNYLRRIAADFVAGAVAGILLCVLLRFGLWPWAGRGRLWDVLGWGPPIFLIVFLLAVSVQVGLRGVTESDEAREWRASMGAWLLIYALLWSGVFAISFYGPLAWQLLGDWAKTKNTLILSWIGSTVAAILAGKSPNSGGPNSATKTEWVAKIAPVVAVLGLLILVASLSNEIVNQWSSTEPTKEPSIKQNAGLSKIVGTARINSEPVQVDVKLQAEEALLKKPHATHRYWRGIKRAKPEVIGLLLALCFAVAGVLAYTVDVNEFSLHASYRNRLVRCYLGASSGDDRNPDWITGFDPNDDFPLASLRSGLGHQHLGCYDGPFLIVNTALNLMAGKELAWQQRKAFSFVLTPRFCGGPLTDYRETEKFCGGINLGTAFAISGAAVSPNMGYHSSGPIAFLLTLFNVRLGWWVGNPKKNDKYKNRGPKLGFPYLLTELFGQSNADRGYVYLSDGGHFENLGIYELVRRRCKYIVCCDAGADPLTTFEDLGNAIRKIRADLGVSIEIVGEMIRPQPGQSHSRWHQAIGVIRYDQVDSGESVGMLVYIKASLTGDEPADVLEHAGRHPMFPHDTTADQFFDESQFESYRKLGEHVAWEVFRSAAPELNKGSDAIFNALRHHWVSVPPGIEESFLHQKEAWIELEAKLREDPQLAGYDLRIYPELERLLGAAPHALLVRDPRAELHFCNRQIQLMENVFIALQFREYHAYALNRGWMNLFRRWAAAPTFQKLWPGLRGSYSRSFVDFVEENLLPQFYFDIVEQVPAYLEAQLLDEFEQDRLSLAILPQVRQVFEEPLPLGATGRNAVWIVVPRTLQPPTEAWGMAVAAPTTDPNVHQLFVWIRGAHRNLGLGSGLLDKAIPLLKQNFTGRRLLVDLGGEDPSSAGYQQRKAAWLRFYCQRGFEKDSSDRKRLRLTLQL